ncbi:hypothetical protein SCLCIDRAFT_27928 [Scleroderma citrinum Foug A]|uniref:Uncharacterized protein n=1 Tax=Scleroderma citrinum Foug A TaxID=1036808 RepID=A0A0C2Z9W7_9AGAM|nr:hypothetical protein SCLCIDRAFT_27928 [Scleroderma citrinum Foug A]
MPSPSMLPPFGLPSPLFRLPLSSPALSAVSPSAPGTIASSSLSSHPNTNVWLAVSIRTLTGLGILFSVVYAVSIAVSTLRASVCAVNVSIRLLSPSNSAGVHIVTSTGNITFILMLRTSPCRLGTSVWLPMPSVLSPLHLASPALRAVHVTHTASRASKVYAQYSAAAQALRLNRHRNELLRLVWNVRRLDISTWIAIRHA